MDSDIDYEKRENLFRKYGLLNKKPNAPMLVTLDDFFIGNNDYGSIAANSYSRPSNQEYYKLLKKIQSDPRIKRILVNLNDLHLYEGNKFSEFWPYADYIYVVGNMPINDLRKNLEKLMPDEINFVQPDDEILDSIKFNKNEDKLIYIWWD